MQVERVFAGMTALSVVFLGIAGCAATLPVADSVTTPVSMPATSSNAVAVQASTTPLAAVAGMPAIAVTPVSVEAPSDYLIGPQDLLKVEVFGVENLNRSVRVNLEVKSLPLVGLVRAGADR